MVVGLVALLLLAAFIPAPLEPPADPAHAPNPAKSAWFLLWIQELVSYSTPAIYVALVLVADARGPAVAARCRSWSARPGSLASTARSRSSCSRPCGLVLALTVVGLFMRGPDWRFVSPF